MTIQELTEAIDYSKLNTGTNYAWYWTPLRGVIVRAYNPIKSGGEHDSMAGALGLDDIDELPRGQFWVSNNQKKVTSHISYNSAPKPPNDIHLQLRKKLKIPDDWAHYSNDEMEWLIKNPMSEDYIEEGWKPKNKSKHQACKQRVKNRVSVWPSAYASAQVVQCYYGKKKRKKKAKSVNEMLSNNLCETTVSKEDLQDALQVLKDWSYQIGAIWDVPIDRIWNNLVNNAQIDDINVNELKIHHDWGRRPSESQMKNPIIVGKMVDGKYLVLDGQHRIIRAKELNKEKIKALVINLPLRYSKMLRRYSQVQGS